MNANRLYLATLSAALMLPAAAIGAAGATAITASDLQKTERISSARPSEAALARYSQQVANNIVQKISTPSNEHPLSPMMKQNIVDGLSNYIHLMAAEMLSGQSSGGQSSTGTCLPVAPISLCKQDQMVDGQVTFCLDRHSESSCKSLGASVTCELTPGKYKTFTYGCVWLPGGRTSKP